MGKGQGGEAASIRIIVEVGQEGKKEACCLLNSLYNNILHLRPLRLSSDSHFRTFTVLERIVPSSACSSLFDRLSLQSYRSENNTFNVKLFPRCLLFLILPFSSLALPFFVHWVVLLCAFLSKMYSQQSLTYVVGRTTLSLPHFFVCLRACVRQIM